MREKPEGKRTLRHEIYQKTLFFSKIINNKKRQKLANNTYITETKEGPRLIP